MALNKTNLKTAILNLLDDMADRIDNPAQAREDFATQLSDAIDTYVKTATIKYNSGLAAGTTAVTGTFNGNLQ